MAITALPTPPTRSDPTTFAVRADAFMTALPTFATEANALQTDVNAKEVTASAAAVTATTQAGNASTSASTASTGASTATTQAGIATTQAGIATTKAGEAQTSAIAAAASAASINLSSIDINGGTIDGTVIGGASPAAGSFTTLSASGATTLAGTSGSGSVVTIGGSPTNDQMALLKMITSTTARNWQISANNYIGSNLEFTPSTAGGGSTFTTPVATLSTSGLSVTGALSATTGITNTAATSAASYLTGTNGSGVVTSIGVAADNGSLLGTTSAHSLRIVTGGAVQATLDTAGNLALGVTPRAWNTAGKAIEVSRAGNAIYSTGANTRYDTSNAYLSAVGGWTYADNGYATRYDQYNGTHAWYTAPSGTAGNAITFTQAMECAASGQFQNYSTADGMRTHLSASAGTVSAFFVGYHSATSVSDGTISYLVTSNGNVTNTNNSYGAISDLKLKENIVDCTPKLAKLLQVRIVNYNLKTDPEHKQIGVIAQELEQISPGLIEESPDYIEVAKTREVTKTRTVKVPTQVTKTRQATMVTDQEQTSAEIVLLDGKYVQQVTTTNVQVSTPLFDTNPVFDVAGQPVLVVDVPERTEGEGEDIVVFPATYKQLTHQTPRMESYVETVDVDVQEEYFEVEEYTEREATGEVTKSVKYSVFVPMLIKAMQEQQAQIEALTARLSALEAA